MTEDDFFSRGSSGGTYISSGLEKALEIVEKRYPPQSWNLYTFHCSDGDNWADDNQKALDYSIKLRDMCQLYSYIQITEGNNKGYTGWGEAMANIYQPISNNKFKIVEIDSKEDIWPQFQKLFKGNSSNE